MVEHSEEHVELQLVSKEENQYERNRRGNCQFWGNNIDINNHSFCGLNPFTVVSIFLAYSNYK